MIHTPIIVPGTLGLVSLFVTAWLLILGNQDGELIMGQQNSFQRTIPDEKHLDGQFMGQRNNTQSTISDEKLFRKEPFWVDGTNPELELCKDFCSNKQSLKNMHPVNNGTPPTGLCFRISRNFSDQKSCQFFTDLQENNSFKHRRDKTKRKEGRKKRSEVGLGSVRRAL